MLNQLSTDLLLYISNLLPPEAIDALASVCRFTHLFIEKYASYLPQHMVKMYIHSPTTIQLYHCKPRKENKWV